MGAGETSAGAPVTALIRKSHDAEWKEGQMAGNAAIGNSPKVAEQSVRHWHHPECRPITSRGQG
jgi:hypothetical protein